MVPLSTSVPEPMMDYHCLIELSRPLPKPFTAARMWAKCDLVAAVSFDRLSMIRIGKGKYIAPELAHEDIQRLRHAVVAGLGLHDLL